MRVEVEQGRGRTFIALTPPEIALRAGDGIEWDLRYLGGSDVVVNEIIVEFEKPSPFPKTSIKSQKPGGARPHRLIAGPSGNDAVGRRSEYVIRCVDMYRSELARVTGYITVTA